MPFSKRFTGLLLVAVLFAGAQTATAQFRVGYTDAELVMVNMPDYKTNATKLQKRVQNSQAELQAAMSEFQADVQKFEKQAPLLSEETQAKRSSELETRYGDLQKQGAAKDQELAEYEAELMEPIITRVNDAIEQVAADKKLDLVFRAPALLFAKSSENVIDITPDVARKLGITVEDETASN